MQVSRFKRNIVLSILFFLPVTFLLFLYPAKHHYTPLDIVNNQPCNEFIGLKTLKGDVLRLEDHITVVLFLGKSPMDYVTASSNLKELVYDKFKGFKKFQIVAIASDESRAQIDTLKSELTQYDSLKYWYFLTGSDFAIGNFFSYLNSDFALNDDLGSNHVYIIDKELMQRGRLDDRSKQEKSKASPSYPLYSYDCIEVADIKNKMSEDMRILFTEYRQKRKGNFDSNSRRASDLKK